MAIFAYSAKDLQGAYHKGEIEASEEKIAVTILRRKRLIIISLKIKHDQKKKLLAPLLDKVSSNDLVVMTRQLATMISAGLVLSEALDVLSEQQNKTLREVLEKVSADVKGGLDFATALEKHPDVFPRLYINLVRVGELSGKLDIVLLQLATHLEKDREFKAKVKGAMIYPIIVVAMMFLVMLIMIFFVMPRLISLYKQSNIELPLPTKIMITTSTLTINFWWLELLIVIGLVITFRWALKNPAFKSRFDAKILTLPIVGRIISIIILTNFTHTFALLIAAGIPILDSIKFSQDIVSNLAYKMALQVSYAGVERGLTFSSQLLAQPVFPKLVGQMIKTGEDTGKLDEVMSKVADYYESETENALKNLTTLIEPIILLILGVGVALLVLSIILPIYKLTTNIS